MNFKNLFLFVISILGLFPQSDAFAQEIKKVTENTPVVLQHSYDFQNDRSLFITKTTTVEKDVELRHYSHYSHRSHYSHTSHTSHTSHRSHYSSSY